MSDEEKLFYTIGEVSEIVKVKPYVLRFWESQFRKLNPQKSDTGQRNYRKHDIQIALTIHRLLYIEKYTIAGAIQKLGELEENNKLDPFGSLTTGLSKANMLPDETLEDQELLKDIKETDPFSKESVNDSQKLLELKHLMETSKSILKKYQQL